MEQLQTNETPSTARIAMRYGLYFGLGLIIYSLILSIIEMEFSWLAWLSFIVITVGIFMALQLFRKENKNAMTFGQGFGLGMQMLVIIALLSSMFRVTYSFYIDPSSRDRELKYTLETTEQWAKKFNAPENAVDKQLEEIENKFKETGPGKVFFTTLIANIIIGTIIVLIIAAILKRKRDVFAQ